MNFMQYGTQATRPMYQNNNWGINRVRPVSSFEEVKAASIDFDGSAFYFPDLANKKIYTKQINMDGTALFNMYELKEMPSTTVQSVVDTSNFITRTEFENVIQQIKNVLVQNAVPAQEAAPSSELEDTQSGKQSFEF